MTSEKFLAFLEKLLDKTKNGDIVFNQIATEKRNPAIPQSEEILFTNGFEPHAIIQSLIVNTSPQFMLSDVKY